MAGHNALLKLVLRAAGRWLSANSPERANETVNSRKCYIILQVRHQRGAQCP